jgi:O-methyltransferase domain/Dimerisation domain
VSERAPESVLWDFLRGGMMSRALAIAADLGVAELLTAGPRRVDELARDAGADPEALHRLLRALASDGVFAEDEPGVFRNSEPSDALRGEGWPEFAHLFGGVFYEAIRPLDRAVQTGKSTFPETFGSDFWAWLADHPAERSRFDRAMAGGKDGPAERLAALEWRDSDVVVDVGGGNGRLLAGLVRRRPELRGIVFDLPETERDEAALGDRIEFVAGSFFERVPPGDAYLLSGILHDWDDERAGAILSSIRAAAPPDARVLILESVIPPGNNPNGAKWLDLLMLVLAGGRERTHSQWRELLEQSGLEPVNIADGLIEARCQ